ncbi:hypothetical protein [Mucilaginibacter sp.]
MAIVSGMGLQFAEWVLQDDIKDMLLFYDFITHLIDDLFEYSQYLNRRE